MTEEKGRWDAQRIALMQANGEALAKYQTGLLDAKNA